MTHRVAKSKFTRIKLKAFLNDIGVEVFSRLAETPFDRRKTVWEDIASSVVRPGLNALRRWSAKEHVDSIPFGDHGDSTIVPKNSDHEPIFVLNDDLLHVEFTVESFWDKRLDDFFFHVLPKLIGEVCIVETVEEFRRTDFLAIEPQSPDSYENVSADFSLFPTVDGKTTNFDDRNDMVMGELTLRASRTRLLPEKIRRFFEKLRTFSMSNEEEISINIYSWKAHGYDTLIPDSFVVTAGIHMSETTDFILFNAGNGQSTFETWFAREHHVG